MRERRDFPWLAVILGGGIVVGVCVLVLLVSGGVFYLLSQRAVSTTVTESIVKTPKYLPEAVITITPESPEQIIEPSVTAPYPTALALTGEQRLEEFLLYDDFSSVALGWPIFHDGRTRIYYEQQAYAIQIIEPNFYDWAFFPVDFIPYEIWFDVQGLPGLNEGSFGVFCHFHDTENYYYVEFDLKEEAYIIGQAVDGEYIYLTEKNAQGLNWQVSNSFISPPTSTNRIGISCYLDSITLVINDQWVDEVNVQQPTDQPGEAAFFVYAYDIASQDGYKVFFDNVEIWQPVQ
jgi:hypothetical protein